MEVGVGHRHPRNLGSCYGSESQRMADEALRLNLRVPAIQPSNVRAHEIRSARVRRGSSDYV